MSLESHRNSTVQDLDKGNADTRIPRQTEAESVNVFQVGNPLEVVEDKCWPFHRDGSTLDPDKNVQDLVENSSEVNLVVKNECS